MNSEADYKVFAELQINRPLNSFITPIEIYLVEFKENKDKNDKKKKGMILSKFDHCFSDGLGLIAL